MSTILNTTFFIFNIKTFATSLFSYFNSGINKFATSFGVLIMLFLLSIGLEIRLVSSHIAFSCKAFTLPIPFICINSSIAISCKNLKFSVLTLLFKFRILCAIDIDDSSFVPVFIIIANNSAFDKLSAPYFSNFSYGLSDRGNSFIFINFPSYLSFFLPLLIIYINHLRFYDI